MKRAILALALAGMVGQAGASLVLMDDEEKEYGKLKGESVALKNQISATCNA